MTGKDEGDVPAKLPYRVLEGSVELRVTKTGVMEHFDFGFRNADLGLKDFWFLNFLVFLRVSSCIFVLFVV